MCLYICTIMLCMCIAYMFHNTNINKDIVYEIDKNDEYVKNFYKIVGNDYELIFYHINQNDIIYKTKDKLIIVEKELYEEIKDKTYISKKTKTTKGDTYMIYMDIC